MSDFARCIEFVLAEEGGTVNDPHDPGGLTKYGISQRSYPDVDILRLTLDDATAIYRRDYWDKIRGDELPAGIDLLVFDSAVNQGVAVASRLLQASLNVHVDGAIGPMSIKAACETGPDKLAIDFCARRAFRYATSRNIELFGRGWFLRLFRAYAEARRMGGWA